VDPGGVADGLDVATDPALDEPPAELARPERSLR
jgi:hypothetical protein